MNKVISGTDSALQKMKEDIIIENDSAALTGGQCGLGLTCLQPHGHSLLIHIGLLLVLDTQQKEMYSPSHTPN